METIKNCKNCLHIKVCKDYENIKKTFSSIDNQSFNDKDKMLNAIADNCNNYLVYDERSTEVFMQKVKSTINSIEWSIAMCKPQGEVSKKTLNSQSDEWFKKDFVGCLERGKEQLNKIYYENET